MLKDYLTPQTLLNQDNIFVNPERYFVTKFVEKISRLVKPGESILDAGAGECVYKGYFNHAEYKSSDYCVGDEEWDYKHIDYVCRLHEIPVEDNTFDNILCTQTLEHVPNPKEVIGELYRVLKPGGKLFLTAPLFHQEHQTPYDFYRYTQYGLRYLLEENGFEVKSIEHGGGFLLVAGNYFKHMPALIFSHKLLFFIRIPLLVVTNIIYLLSIPLDNNNKRKPNAPTFNYLSISVKK